MSTYLIFILCIIAAASCTKKDIVFVLDQSGSVGHSQFQQALDFVYNVTKFLTVGSKNIQISLVLFDSNVTKVFDFNDYPSKQVLLNAIRTTHRTSSLSTDTAGALNYAWTLFNTSNGARNGANKTVVILTDGQSDSQTATINSANRLRSNGVEVFGIGIGNSFANSEIIGIGGGSQTGNALTVGGFEYLCNLVPTLVPKLDPSALNALVNRCPTEPPYVNTTPNVWYNTLPTWSNPPVIWTSALPEYINNKEEQSDNITVIAAVTTVSILLTIAILLLLIRRKLVRKRRTDPLQSAIIIIGQPPIACKPVFNSSILRG